MIPITGTCRLWGMSGWRVFMLILGQGWYDFGLMAEGNSVDFLLRYHDCLVTDLLERINVSFSPHQLHLLELGLYEGRASAESKLTVKKVSQMYAYPLKNSLHKRSIPAAVVDRL